MFNTIKKCFVPEDINTGLQRELDMAKGFAIAFMIWTHVFEQLSPQSEGIGVTLVRNILGGPFAAPIFMICLGVGICYSRKNMPADLLKRGINLLGIGLLLNVFRYVLPGLIQYAVLKEPKYLDSTFSLFSVDILQFAGLAFIFLAAAKRLKLNNFTLLIIGAFSSVLGMILRGVSTGNYVADQFIGFLWGTDTQTYFPFLNWIIFPIAGLIFGSYLRRCNDKRKLYLHVTPLCLGIMLIYLILTIRYGFMFLSGSSYYFLGLWDALFFVVLAILVFGLCYGIMQLFPKLSFRPLMGWSKRINSIYCIHWTLIGVIGIVLNFLEKTNNMQFWQGTMIAAILLIISDILSTLYIDGLKPKFVNANK